MFNWIVNRVTDILLAFAVATLILGYAAYHYPELFPRQLYQYWPIAAQQAPQQSAVSANVQP